MAASGAVASTNSRFGYTVPSRVMVSCACQFSPPMKPCVAEGIETPEQLRYAREMGFTNVQGFILSRESVTPTTHRSN